MRPPHGRSRRGASGRFKLWDVPPAAWAYGWFRAMAFGVPFVTGTGGFGLGMFVVLFLYVLLLRRSRIAYMVLVTLDVLSFVLLLVTQSQTSAPWVLHIFTGLAIASLLMPATRRYVTRTPDPREVQ